MDLEPTDGIDMETDLPPEFCRYQDDGCELATAYLGGKSCCLNCPFSRCVYDEPGGKQRMIKRLRAREMARLFNTEGKRIWELAAMFGVSRRTVQRALKAASDDEYQGMVNGDEKKSRASGIGGNPSDKEQEK
ncbi:MAG: helix-turn-helix domain-containing protein [Dehalococcoidales bacterium]|nr:MAG: helix-turn-helix domain-containing protein [Dehalococcoidales bacterium]